MSTKLKCYNTHEFTLEERKINQLCQNPWEELFDPRADQYLEPQITIPSIDLFATPEVLNFFKTKKAQLAAAGVRQYELEARKTKKDVPVEVSFSFNPTFFTQTCGGDTVELTCEYVVFRGGKSNPNFRTDPILDMSSDTDVIRQAEAIADAMTSEHMIATFEIDCDEVSDDLVSSKIIAKLCSMLQPELDDAERRVAKEIADTFAMSGFQEACSSKYMEEVRSTVHKSLMKFDHLDREVLHALVDEIYVLKVHSS